MKRISVIWITILSIGMCITGADSKTQKVDPFANVPSAQREALKARLSDFVEYHRSKQWEKVYNLLGEQGKAGIQGGLSKERFLTEKLYSGIRKFTPKSVQRIDDGWWVIWGCGNFTRDGNMEASLEAYLQNGNWYFSDIWSAVPCVDCSPKGCRH